MSNAPNARQGEITKDEIQAIERLQGIPFGRGSANHQDAVLAMIRRLPEVDDSQWDPQLSNLLQPRLKPTDFWALRLSRLELNCQLPRGHQDK